MANYYTSNELIESIKRRAMIPENQKTFETDDFLALANEEMVLGVVPKVMELHEDYFLREESTALAANTSRYRIPYRAIGSKLRELSYRDSNSNILQMTRIAKEDLPFYQNTSYSSTGNSVQYYYIENSDVVIVPSIGNSVSGSLVFSYYIRPSELVDEGRAAIISAIDTTTGILTIDNIPSHFSTSIVYDLVMAKTPHKIMAIDLATSNVNTTSITITFDPSDLPADLSVGDYVMAAEETIVPQIPSDLHVMLAQRVACRCLEAMGDTQGLQNANAKLQEMEQRSNSLIDNRVEGSPQKTTAHNGLLKNMLARKARRGRF